MIWVPNRTEQKFRNNFFFRQARQKCQSSTEMRNNLPLLDIDILTKMIMNLSICGAFPFSRASTM